MERCIKYFRENTVDLEIVDYSDSTLKDIVNVCLSKVPNCNQILLMFEQCNEYLGQVGVYFSNTLDTSTNKKYAAFSLHNIDLTSEEWSDCVKECQREKAVIKRAFPDVKCVSNFR